MEQTKKFIEQFKQFLFWINSKIESYFLMALMAVKFSLMAIGGIALLGFFIGSGILTVISIFSLLYFYSAFTSAFVGFYLWQWFVVPNFGLPALTFSQIFGITLLINYWTYHHFSQHVRDERTWKQKTPETLGLMLRPWWTLLIGWICYHFFTF